MPLSQMIFFVLLALRRQKWIILAMLLLVGGILSALILLAPPRYVAQTTLIAKFGREYIMKADDGSSFVPFNFGQSEIVSSVVEIMRSASLLDDVVSKIGATQLYPDLATAPLPEGATIERAAANRLGADLGVAPSRGTNIIVVALANTDPIIAATALNTFVEAFQTKYLSLYGETRIPFLQADLDRTRADLVSAEAAETAFVQGRQAYEDIGQLGRLVEDRSDLQRSYEGLVECCSTSTGAQELQRRIANIDAQIADLNASQSELRRIVRIRELAQEAYDRAERRLADARLSESMDASRMTSVQVMEPAIPPLRPARPGKTPKILLVLAISGLLSLAAATLLEILRRRFSVAAELRRTFDPVPVLAEVPRW